MKLFGKWEIRKVDNVNNCNCYQSTLADALNFGSFYNNNSAMAISAVFRAVEIISDSVAMLPIKINRGEAKHKEEDKNHPLYYVFDDRNYNNTLTKYNFMKLLIQSVLLKGNGFAYINRDNDGNVVSLRFLESSDVAIHYDKKQNTLYYTAPIITSKNIQRTDMIHLVKNSYDGINGVPVLTYAARALKIANNTENSASSFFTNGCNLAGILKVNGQLSDKQKHDIRTAWAQAYQQGGNGLAVLPGNMEYQPVQLSASDSQLLESRIFNVQDIARFFGISPVLLGDLTHTSYSTMEATQTQFLLHTLEPYIVMVELEFSRKLLKPSESNYYINLDENYILKSDKTAQASYYSSLLDKGVLCINEVRKDLGLSEVDGGDKHIIPFTDLNMNTINNSDVKTSDDVSEDKPAKATDAKRSRKRAKEVESNKEEVENE